MLENYISKIFCARRFLIGLASTAFCCLILSGCGGGGAGAACVAAVGALGGNACANAANKNNNTPAPPPLTAGNLQYTVNENQTLNNYLTVNNPNNIALTYTILNQPSNGMVTPATSTTGAFTYTPIGNFHGLDQFTYNISGGGQISNPGIVNVSVVPQFIAPVANGATFNLPSSNPYTDLVSGYDFQGYPLTFSVVNTTSYGSLNLNTNTGVFTYTPNPGTTSDSFKFLVNDGTADSRIATVNLIVHATASPTITWGSQGILGIYNDFTPPNINNVNIQLNATCSNGGPVTYQVGDLPLPPGLTMTSSGQIAGATTPIAAGSLTPMSYEISAIASCPGSNPTFNTNPMQILVLPPNIIQISSAGAVISGLGVCPVGATAFLSIQNGGACSGPAVATAGQITAAPAAYTITTPAWLSNFSAMVIGGGGGGAAGGQVYLGSGGGAGGYLYYSNIPLTPGNSIAALAGAGGVGGAVATLTTTDAGWAGLASWVAQLANQGTTLLSQITAQGGKGGTGSGASGGAEPGSNALPPYTSIVSYAGGTVVLGQSEGGGGGAAGAGQTPAGGPGAANNITGTFITYATGGSGGSAGIPVPVSKADGNGGNGGTISGAGVAGDPGVVIIRF